MEGWVERLRKRIEEVYREGKTKTNGGWVGGWQKVAKEVERWSWWAWLVGWVERVGGREVDVIQYLN